MNLYVVLSFLWFYILACPVELQASNKKFIPITQQTKADTISCVKADTIKTRDLYDVIASLFGQKDFKLKTDSVTAKPVVSVVPALGYTLQSKLAITLAGNIAFRLSPRTKISTIIINVAYTQTKQIIVPIQSSIWTNNNDYNYVGDIRYLKYPESTYGLGSNSNIANNDPMDYSFFRFYETVLKRISGNFFAGAGYVLDVHWNVTHEGPLNGAVSDYANYADPNKTVSSGITLNSLFDNRDNSINPSKGFYAALQYRDNKGFLGSTRNWQSLVVDIRKYYKLPATSNNVLALWSYNWLVLGGKPPYVDLPSNTWDTFSGTGRGYIQGRFRGAQMVYLESEYRFKISANGLFGGVVFVNAQSFSAMQGTLLQSVQPAFGPGLRIKVNKISKTNIAIDYGIGRQGSRGVFINVGEVF